MTAIDALRAARAAKIDVGIEGTHLVLRAPAPPPPAVIDALKLNKPAIVAILAAGIEPLERGRLACVLRRARRHRRT